MAALDFPSNPSLNDTYTANGKTFQWNGTSWLNKSFVASGGTNKQIIYNESDSLTGANVYFDSTNNRFGIGIDTPTEALDVVGNGTFSGDINTSSDARLKDNIQTLQNSLQTVKSLRGVSYIKDGKESIGLIAQEVLEVLPEVVNGNEENYYSIAYGNIIALLVEAIKELEEQVQKINK